MKNITAGFRDYDNFRLEAQTVIDGVRFWKGDNGEYGIMDASSRYYFETNQDTEFMKRTGLLPSGMFTYLIEASDMKARALTQEERSDLKAYFSFMTPALWRELGWELQYQRL